MQFSDRIGVTSPTLGLHIDDMPQGLRVSLWNLFLELYNARDLKYWGMVAAHVARYFRKFPVDDLPYRPGDLRDWMKEYFFGLVWYEAYNLLEFMVRTHDIATRERNHSGYHDSHSVRAERVELAVNSILERENSGYRFIAHVLSPIADKVELQEVEKATELRGKGLEGARKHIRAALELFSKRPNPDFRNAIKESISAIESIAKQLGQDKGDGLASALRAL
jgi:hypothetical protein